jgi:hypothetical protein
MWIRICVCLACVFHVCLRVLWLLIWSFAEFAFVTWQQEDVGALLDGMPASPVGDAAAGEEKRPFWSLFDAHAEQAAAAHRPVPVGAALGASWCVSGWRACASAGSLMIRDVHRRLTAPLDAWEFCRGESETPYGSRPCRRCECCRSGGTRRDRCSHKMRKCRSLG